MQAPGEYPSPIGLPISGLRMSRNAAVSTEILRLGDAANAPGAACQEPNVSERISTTAASAREHVCPLKATNATEIKRQLLVICNICKRQGFFIQNDNPVSNTDGDVQGKEFQVFNSL